MKNNIIISVAVMLMTSFSVRSQSAYTEHCQADRIRKQFTETSVVSYSPDSEVTEKFIEYSDYGRANDVLLLQLYMSVKLPDEEIERLAGLFDERGFWTDIDYNDKTRGRWQPTLHITRMYALAKHYSDPSSLWYKNQGIGRILHKGIAYWGETWPSCPNWWHNDIGVPKKLTAVLLMMYDELSEDEINTGLKALERSNFGRTGQNKVWLAGNNLMKGLLTNDESLIIRARDQIAEEIKVTDREGIQEDWSFHQHGPQIQFGNYGLAYAESLSFWFRVLEGSPYMFSDRQREILENMIMDGICRSVWNGVMDPSYCGRQVFINAGRGKAYSLAVAAQNMAALKSPRSKAFHEIAMEILSPDTHTDILRGPKYFWRSDCGIYRTEEWYSSIRMHSERTVGFEYTNKENLLANFSADGALLFMQHGREYENIFAHWDWRKIPGTTTYEDRLPIRCPESDAEKTNRSLHVGGLSKDNILCTTMELERDGLHALKSNFFFEDLVIALGSDIRSSDPAFTRVTTAIDQNHLVSEVSSGSNWIHHDGRGYVSLDGAEIQSSAEEQEGKWDPIDPFYKDKSEKGKVFKCWFEHSPSLQSSYSYAYLPCRTAAQTGQWAEKPSVRIIRNDGRCQALKYNGVICAVFHIPGQYDIDSENFVITEPSIYIVKDGKRTVCVLPGLSDPSDTSLSFDYNSIASHPRLLFKSGEEENIRSLLAKDTCFRKIHNGIICFCDSILDAPVSKYAKTGKRMLSVSRTALQRIFWLSYSYRMTSDRRYAERAIDEMKAVCAFRDWNPSHFLDTGEMGMAVAVGFDWLYDTMDDKDRHTITESLDRHLFQAAEAPKYAWFYKSGNNWNQVCNAGMVYAALATYEYHPAKTKLIIEKSITSDMAAIECYAPDGGYPEGFGYWSYGTSFQIMMNEALASALGSDAGISKAPGFLESARFIQFMSAPSGKCYNFSDTGEHISGNIMMFWFAEKMKDNSLIWLEKQYMQSLPENFHQSPDKWFSEARLLPALLIFASRMDCLKAKLPEANVCFFRGRTPVFVWREGWNSPKDGYFAIKGGSPSTSHAHLDAGSFVYEYGGIRWSSDLGSQNYFSLESKGVDLWGQKQTSGRWDVFRIDNISHSTITLDGRHHRVDGYADIGKTFNGKNRKGAVVDLTSVLGKDLVNKASRTAYIDRKGFLYVEDEIENGKNDISLQWIMTAPDNARITGNRTIEIIEDGIRMQLSVSSAIPVSMLILPNDPPKDYDAPNPGTCRIGFKADIKPETRTRFRISLREKSKHKRH